MDLGQTAPLANVVLASDKDIRGGGLLIALFMMVWGGVFTGGPIAIALFGKVNGSSGLVLLLFPVIGLTVLGFGLRILLTRRGVVLHGLTGEIEEIDGLLGRLRTRRRLSGYHSVQLHSERAPKGWLVYKVELHGPGNLVTPIGLKLTERNDALLQGLHAARATGLPLDQLDLEGMSKRLSSADIAGLPPLPSSGASWWKRPEALALVVANMVPLGGVLFFNWEVLPLMLLFWLENLVIGGYALVRLALAQGSMDGTQQPQPVGPVGKLMLGVFFVLHYGMFSTAHGSILLSIFDRANQYADTGTGPVALFALTAHVVGKYHLQWPLLALALSHGVSLWLNYLRSGAYREAAVGDLMTQPYKRVVLLHVIIVIGGMMAMFSGGHIAALALLVLVKTGVDLAAHLHEHTREARGGRRQIQAIAALMPGLPRAPVAARQASGQVAGAPAAAAPADSAVPAVPMATGPAHTDINDQPLAHYLSGWALAPGEQLKPGWIARVQFREEGGRIRLRLEDHETGAVQTGALQKIDLRGNTARVEFIEVRLLDAGRERILRFTASGTHGDRIDLNEIQQPAGKPRDMQARSVSLVRTQSVPVKG